MESTTIWMGISLSVFMVIHLLTIKNIKISNIILVVLFLNFIALSILNIIKYDINYRKDLWPISLFFTMGISINLFLYSIYITNDFQKLKKNDYLFYLPQFIILFFIIISYDSHITDLISFGDYFNKQITLRMFLGIFFEVCFFFYTLGSLYNIYKYKKQIVNIYSFKSYTINLNWLIIIVASFFIAYTFIILISSYHTWNLFIVNIEIFRNGTLLVLIFLFSFFGLKQQQLISNNYPITLNNNVTHIESDKYNKIKLKKIKAEEYKTKLINLMNNSQIWKEQELTVAKISELTEIPKYYISQVLNENIQKNFYTFVNEYRIEYAKQLLSTSEYQSWSIEAISYESGFNSKAAFNKFFKKYTEMTPSEYKRKFLQQ